jgi:outer membrane protein assembly factor BamB
MPGPSSNRKNQQRERIARDRGTARPRCWLPRAVAGLAGLLVMLAVAAAVLVLCTPSNVSHASVPSLSRARARFIDPKPAAQKPAPSDFEWQFYGYDAARTRFISEGQLAPPFHRGWRFDDGALIEFPPVIYQHTLYFLDDGGSAKAVDSLTGRLIWQRKVGTLSAASPALDVRDRLVFVSLLSTSAGAAQPGNGSFLALSMDSGRVVWRHAVAPGSESSPLLDGSNVFFGDQDGTVYSLRTRDGHLNWTYQASGAVKGGIALADGTLYFGDYGGHVYALNAADGHQVWAASPGGEFYATPAVAFGRVFLGNINGSVYAFAQSTGELAWTTATGAYVYASPAVADVPGLGPTVYLGSYDGNFYALDALSGATRWTHPAGGRVSGSATIVGRVVYYSVLGASRTTGLDVRTGQQVFLFPDGEFTPVICDEGAIYLIGYSTIYQLLPR